MKNKAEPILVKIGAGLLVTSGLFFYFNFAIGDTILGNVIVLFISAMAGIGVFALSCAGLVRAPKSVVLYLFLGFSTAILISIIILFITGNVAVGYGP